MVGGRSEGNQVTSEDADLTQNRHEDQLILIFDKLSMFQEGIPHKIRTVTDRRDNMEASTLMGFAEQGSSRMEMLVDNIYEM